MRRLIPAPSTSRRFLDLLLRVPLLSLVLLCLTSVHSQTSYTWRLDLDVGKVLPSLPQPPPPLQPPQPPQPQAAGPDRTLLLELEQEAVLDILLSTVTSTDGTWRKTARDRDRASAAAGARRSCPGGHCHAAARQALRDPDVSNEDDDDEDDDWRSEELDCGRPVNFTYYDHLVGIQNRASHPQITEPEVALTFKSLLASSNNSKKQKKDVNIDAVERKLKKSKRERPKSVELYNQIGQFWRVKGDTRKSIECFRRALAVSPNNAEILLNLARVMFNLQFLDDACFLTRRSLEVQPPDQNAWLQHFQLGEILKASNHNQEAALHLRHVLELKPGYQPAVAALSDMEARPEQWIDPNTLVIIAVLVVFVLVLVARNLGMLGGAGAAEAEFDEGDDDDKKSSSSSSSSSSSQGRARPHAKHKR